MPARRQSSKQGQPRGNVSIVGDVAGNLTTPEATDNADDELLDSGFLDFDGVRTTPGPRDLGTVRRPANGL